MIHSEGFFSAEFINNTLAKYDPNNGYFECQTVWIQILSSLVCIQTVCKDHQQMSKFTSTSRQRVNNYIKI